MLAGCWPGRVSAARSSRSPSAATVRDRTRYSGEVSNHVSPRPNRRTSASRSTIVPGRFHLCRVAERRRDLTRVPDQDTCEDHELDACGDRDDDGRAVEPFVDTKNQRAEGEHGEYRRGCMQLPATYARLSSLSSARK